MQTTLQVHEEIKKVYFLMPNIMVNRGGRLIHASFHLEVYDVSHKPKTIVLKRIGDGFVMRFKKSKDLFINKGGIKTLYTTKKEALSEGLKAVENTMNDDYKSKNHKDGIKTARDTFYKDNK